MAVQKLQPAEVEADPAEWAEGELHPSSQPVDSVGSAPARGAKETAADTANSEDVTAVVSSTAGQTEPANDAESMQMDVVPRQDQTDVLATTGATTLRLNTLELFLNTHCSCLAHHACVMFITRKMSYF
jgi:hypothetical protein